MRSRSVLRASAFISRQWTPTCTFQFSSKAFWVRNPGWRRGWVRSADDRRAKSRKRRPERMADSEEGRGKRWSADCDSGIIDQFPGTGFERYHPGPHVLKRDSCFHRFFKLRSDAVLLRCLMRD